MKIEQALRNIVKGKISSPNGDKATVTMSDMDGKEFRFDDITDVTLEQLSLVEHFDHEVDFEGSRPQTCLLFAYTSASGSSHQILCSAGFPTRLLIKPRH